LEHAVISVEYAGKIMDGYTADSDGAIWTTTGLDGLEGPDALATFVDITSRAGNVNTLSQHSGRPLTVSGTVECLTPAAARTARDWLKGVANTLSSHYTTTLVVNDNAAMRQIETMRAGKPKIAPVTETSFDYQLTLMATDPFFTAMDPTFLALDSTTVVTNAGNWEALPQVFITAAGTLILRCGDKTLSTGTTSVPRYAVADANDRTFVDGSGANLYHALVPTSQWLTLVPGSNTLYNLGTANLSILYYDTWT
jgi:hypothetical protein